MDTGIFFMIALLAVAAIGGAAAVGRARKRRRADEGDAGRSASDRG